MLATEIFAKTDYRHCKGILSTMTLSQIALLIFVVINIATVLRIMLRPRREPAARIAWIAVITALPLVGVLGYLFLGETGVGKKRIARLKQIKADMPPLAEPVAQDKENFDVASGTHFSHLFDLGSSISGFKPVGGNSATLVPSSAEMIEALVNDIDNARDHVHVLFYIWLGDESGLKVAKALIEAAQRGVAVRAMADSLGSRTFIASPHWQEMASSGVKLAEILPFKNLISRILTGRVDLRNHRKIVVIDHNLTYCGSQNCADAAFSPKPDFAPWVDAVFRIEGPVARQNQHLFTRDWMIATGEDIFDTLREPIPAPKPGFAAQVIGTGPTDRHLAMSQMFVALLASARKDLVISTPYFVPNEPIQSALQSAAFRGVKTKVIFPARNDSQIIQAVSRSYYLELLEAGVEIYEYEGGLLHTKSLVVDGQFVMIGSANIDRRSFDLNYENNMLIDDVTVAGVLNARQNQYLESSRRVDLSEVQSWSLFRKMWNNLLAMLGPIL